MLFGCFNRRNEPSKCLTRTDYVLKWKLLSLQMGERPVKLPKCPQHGWGLHCPLQLQSLSLKLFKYVLAPTQNSLCLVQVQGDRDQALIVSAVPRSVAVHGQRCVLHIVLHRNNDICQEKIWGANIYRVLNIRYGSSQQPAGKATPENVFILNWHHLHFFPCLTVILATLPVTLATTQQTYVLPTTSIQHSFIYTVSVTIQIVSGHFTET